MVGSEGRVIGGSAAIGMGIFGGLFMAASVAGSSEAVLSAGAPRAYVMADYALALMGLCGLAAVPSLSERVAPLSPALVSWTRSVALLGCALLAVMSLWQADYEMLPLAEVEEAYPAAMSLSALSVGEVVDELVARAPSGWIEVFGVGLWILIVSVLGLRNGSLPAGLSGVGIASGVLAFCTSLGAATQNHTLQAFGAFSVLFVMPIWFFGAGIVVLRGREERVQQEVTTLAPVMATAHERLPQRRARRHGILRLWPS